MLNVITAVNVGTAYNQIFVIVDSIWPFHWVLGQFLIVQCYNFLNGSVALELICIEVIPVVVGLIMCVK